MVLYICESPFLILSLWYFQGLFKATSILRENYGDIYITVGDAMSVREFLEPRVYRHLSVAIPSYLSPLTRQEVSTT